MFVSDIVFCLSESTSSEDQMDLQRAILISTVAEAAKKPADAVDGFFLQIGDRLRALPVRMRNQFEIQVLTDLLNLEQSLDDNPQGTF